MIKPNVKRLICLPPELSDELRIVAAIRKTSVSSLIRQAARIVLDKAESPEA